jgi:hypothetical protein
LIISAAGFGQRTPWSAYSFSNINDELAGYDMSKLAKAVSQRSEDNFDHNTLLPFHISLILTLDKLFTKILTPNVLYSMPLRVPWLTHELDVAKVAFDDLRMHMLDLVSAARSKDAEREANILSKLVQANDAMQADVLEEVGSLDGKRVLTDVEMLSNVFVGLHRFLSSHESLIILLADVLVGRTWYVSVLFAAFALNNRSCRDLRPHS